MSGVIDAVDVVLDTRGSIRLFVSVAVPLMVVKPSVEFAAFPSAVRTLAPVVVVEGATPAPPPITNALAVRAAELAMVLDAEKYGTPPDVPEVMPVPP